MSIKNSEKVLDEKEKNCDELITIRVSELKRLYKKINEYQELIDIYQKEIKALSKINSQ